MQPCLGRTAGYRRQGPSQGLRPRRPDRLRRGAAGDMVAPCPDRVATMPAAESRPSTVLTVAAFLAVTGSFGVGLAVSMHHAAPPETVAEPVEAPPEDLMKVYYPFPEDIFITWPDRTMVIASVSFYLEGSAATLLHLGCSGGGGYFGLVPRMAATAAGCSSRNLVRTRISVVAMCIRASRAWPITWRKTICMLCLWRVRPSKT